MAQNSRTIAAIENSADSESPLFVKSDVQEYLDQLKASPRPRLSRAVLAKIRQVPPERMISADDLPAGELAVIRDVTFGSSGGTIRLRMYDQRAERTPGPVVVFLHGGAFVVGGIESHAGLAAEMARRLDLPVVSVEYRLAPEHPWPAAADDSEAAARWIADNGHAFGRKFTGLVLSGDSAGGNLALVTALALRDKPTSLPLLMQIAIYPSTDLSQIYPSEMRFSQGFARDTAPDDEDFYGAETTSVRASPLLADLSGLPATLLVTASLDSLRDEGRAFASKLVLAGVPTTLYEAKGTIHGFATYRRAIPSAQKDTTSFLSLAKTILDVAISEQ